jgi:NAD(P)-dependent dehydrogenase (short-subunit alcohol dehydrogenase family)
VTALDGKVALVTGSSSGIGAAVARSLAAEGAKVVVNSTRSVEAGERVAGELPDATYVQADVADEASARGLVEAAVERYGRLDVLVNSAGVGVGAAVADIQTKRVGMQLDINVRAIVLAYRECADLLRAAGAEHRCALVVNLSSISGKAGQPWLSVYSATKAAVIGWTQAMNKELNGDGVKSVALCPGFVDTPMTEFIRDQVRPEDMIKTSDVAEAVRFLLRTSPACVVPEIVFQRPGESV